MENTETRVWLDFARACEYISQDEWKALDEKATEIGKLVNHMIENPNKYLTKSQTLKK